jgi:hypothetical protein
LLAKALPYGSVLLPAPFVAAAFMEKAVVASCLFSWD